MKFLIKKLDEKSLKNLRKTMELPMHIKYVYNYLDLYT